MVETEHYILGMLQRVTPFVPDHFHSTAGEITHVGHKAKPTRSLRVELVSYTTVVHTRRTDDVDVPSVFALRNPPPFSEESAAVASEDRIHSGRFERTHLRKQKRHVSA